MNARLARNLTYLMTTMGVQIVSMGLLTIGVARYLDVVGFGRYSFVIALTTGVMTIAQFGLQPIMLREIAVDRARGGLYFASAMGARVIMLVVAGVLTVSLISVLALSAQVKIAIAIALASEFLVGAQNLYRTYFQAIERMELETVVVTAFRVLQLGLVILVFIMDLGFYAIFWAILISNVFQLLMSHLLMRGLIKPELDWQWVWKFMFSESLLLGIGVIIRMNIPKLGVVLTKFISGSDDVAYYQAAQALLMMVEPFPAAIIVAFMPIMSRLAREDRPEFIKAYERITKYFLSVSLVGFMAFFLFPEEIIGIVYGQKYMPSTDALRIMAVMSVFIFLNIAVSNVFIVSGSQKYVAFCGVFALGVILAFTMPMLERWGFVGAAIGTTLAYAAYYVAANVMLVRMNIGIGVKRILRLLAGPLSASAITVLVVWGMKDVLGLNAIICALGAVVLYPLMLLVIGVVSVRELVEMKRQFGGGMRMKQG